jgi:hypothetical protein
MNKAHTFWSAFWQGVAAPSIFYSPTVHTQMIECPSAHRSDRDAMRGDWERIGMDFRHVIAREETNHASN